MKTFEWTEETLNMINDMTKDIQGKGLSPDWFMLRNRFEERDREVERLREALKLWKVYFQSDTPTNAELNEAQGEQFTEAWFKMEEALNFMSANQITCEGDMMKKMEEDEERCCDHASDCAVHNAPGLPVGECDCGVEAWKSVDKLRELIPLARRAPVELEAKVEEVARHLNRVLPRR